MEFTNVYTLTSLSKYLNKKYNNKKSGKKFLPQDVQQYILRGHLPKYLGGNKIEFIPNDLGTKLYKIE